jgi:peptidyl-prolyl cis-trans isomerase D
MLEQMRKSSRSLLIYVLFLIVIAVFIINFGPQSRGGSCESSMPGNDHYAAKVAGDTISTNDFRYGFLVLGGAQYPAQIAKQQRLKETVMDKLIERELLAQEAERLGYIVTEEEVEDLIAEAKMVGLGYPRAVPRLNKDGKFNYEAFKNFVQFELGVTPKSFIEEQKKELLASRVRDLLRGSVTVSPEEVRAEFVRKGRQVNLEYVRFAARRFEGEIAPTEAEVTVYAAKNEAKLRATYDEQKFLYEKVPKELRLRQILIRIPEPSSPETEKAATKKAEAALARINKGEPFAKVAKEVSQDPDSRARSGDVGWRGHGATNLTGDVEEKLFSAKAGDVVGPLKGSGGLYLTKVEGAREGALPFEKVKLDLAETKLRQERSEERARAEAQAALAKARAAPDKSLKELYPPPPEDKADGASGAGKGKAEERALRAEETGLFAARGSREGIVIEGIGPSRPLAKAAFALTKDAPLAGPFDVAGGSVIVRLKERKEPDLAELEKKKLELLRDAELTKWMEVLTDWTHARCLEAKEAKRIQVNGDVLRYEDSSEPPAYEPCLGRRLLGG